MKHVIASSLVLASVLVPAAAFAQPSKPASGQVAFAEPASAQPAPAQPTSADLTAATPAPATPHTGITFEAGLGLGVTRVSGYNHDVNPEAIGIGVGLWATPKLAVMLRIAGHTASEGIYRRYNGVGSLGVQYWVGDRVWLGGGLGVGGVGYVISHGENDGDVGFGADLRAGVVLDQTDAHAIDLSLEVSPFVISPSDSLGRTTYTSIALMLGYQAL